MKKKLYETPRTQHVEVETEGNFCGSVFEGSTENAEGVTIEQHEFANPDAPWEGNYSGSTWD